MSMQDSKEVPQMQPTLCKNLQEADMSNVKTNPHITLVSPEENVEDFLLDIEVGEFSLTVGTTTNNISLHSSGISLSVHRGVPTLAGGGTYLGRGGTYLGWGGPYLGRGGTYLGQGGTHLGRRCIGSTCYVAGGMHLAFRQEDYLVFFCFFLRKCNTLYFRFCVVTNTHIWGFGCRISNKGISSCLFTFWPPCNGFLRFTSGAKLEYLLAASMAADFTSHIHLSLSSSFKQSTPTVTFFSHSRKLEEEVEKEV